MLVFLEKKPRITIDEKLGAKLKPYQIDGVRCMWNACFESTDTLTQDSGGGCILAHCMGLGKTLQVITLVHSLLTHKRETNVQKVLIICPLSVSLNWINEFHFWLAHCNRKCEIPIHEISKFVYFSSMFQLTPPIRMSFLIQDYSFFNPLLDSSKIKNAEN